MHLETAVEQYRDLRDGVIVEIGEDGCADFQALLEATVFDPNLPMEGVFSRIWDKPLRSGVLVGNGEAWAQQLIPIIPQNQLNTFQHEDYTISEDGHAYPIGQSAIALCDSTNAANWRVCNIIRMARRLQIWNNQTLGEALGHENIDVTETLTLINTLSDTFGAGWGTITCFHAAADLGYPVVKPDIHVGRSMFRLGWFHEIGDMGHPYLNSDIDGMFKNSLIIQMAAQTRARLVGNVLLENDDRAFPEIEDYNIIREIDLVLMKASQLGYTDVYDARYANHG